MSMPSTPSKRPLEPNLSESNRRGKWRKTGPNSQRTPSKVPLQGVVFRVICPASKCESVIGKDGILTKICEETGAEINLEDAVPGSEERVVRITGSDKDVEVSNEHTKDGNEEMSKEGNEDKDKEGNEDRDKEGNEDRDKEENENADKEGNGNEGDNGEDKEGNEDDEGDKEANKEENEENGGTDGAPEVDKDTVEGNKEKDETSASEVPKPERIKSSAQKALLLVFERIIVDELENDDSNEDSSVVVRLLISSNQVGCLLGKGGSTMRQMSFDSGSQIRVLGKDKIPSCASPKDDVVQIAGRVNSAKKGLQLVSQQLSDSLLRDPFPAANPPGPSSRPFAPVPRPEVISGANLVPLRGPQFHNRHYDGPDIPPHFPKYHESIAPGQIAGPPEQITFRLLCSNDKIGSVIGKGGSIVKNLQYETGCDIKILETNPESDDRLIVISGPALPGERISPPQDAVLRVQHRIVQAVPENREGTVPCRLIVPEYQTGCLLGKGGAVISEMRKLSGAYIKVFGKDKTPENLEEGDELIQVHGDFGRVQDALMQITGRLKAHIFRDKFAAVSHAGHPPFFDQVPPFGPYMGRRQPSPPIMLGNPYERDMRGRFHDERPAYGHAPHGSGVPLHGAERLAPAPWPAQGVRDGEYGVAPQRRVGGNQPAVITNTAVDVVVPRTAVPAIYGEDGYCLNRIREISEAKVEIIEPRADATETIITISGTPEQAQAAQSLIQAFVLSETGGT